MLKRSHLFLQKVILGVGKYYIDSTTFFVVTDSEYDIKAKQKEDVFFDPSFYTAYVIDDFKKVLKDDSLYYCTSNRQFYTYSEISGCLSVVSRQTITDISNL